MAFELGVITIYDDAVAVHQPDILVAAKAINLAVNQGAFYQSLSAPAAAISGKDFEIYGRTSTSMDSTIGTGAGTGWVDGVATTALPMSAVAVNKLTIGCILKVESEVVVVKAIDRSAYTIAVWSRGAGATTGAAHADTTAFTVIGHTIHDTDLKNVESRAETTNKYVNYCLTIAEAIDYTKSQQLVGRRGVVDNIAILKEEAMLRVAILLSRASLNGIKFAGGKTADPYSSAGLYEQLEDTSGATRAILRYNASSAALSKTILDAALAEAFLRGNPDTIWCTQKYKNIINAFNQPFINTTREDKTAGYSVSQYEYEGKTLSIRVDQDCADTKLAICTQALLQKGFQSSDVLSYMEEPKQSSREHRGTLSGSLGFVVEGVGYDHLEIYGLL